jgi:hypothetical protein
MPVTTLEGRHSIAVGEGRLTSTVRAEEVAGIPATRARRTDRGTFACVPISARVHCIDNASERQSADIGCTDVTAGISVRQLFTPSPQNSFRLGALARVV